MSQQTPREQRLASFWKAQDVCKKSITSDTGAQLPQKGQAYFLSPSYWLHSMELESSMREFLIVGAIIENMDDVKKQKMEKAIGDLPTYATHPSDAMKNLQANLDDVMGLEDATKARMQLAASDWEFLQGYRNNA